MSGVAGGTGGLRRQVGLAALGGVAAGLAVWGVLQLASYRAPVGYCVLVGLAVVACWRLAVAVRPGPQPAPHEEAAHRARLAHRNGFEILSGVEQQLSWGSFDLDRYQARLQPQLVRLAEQRLRRRHSVDPARQPDLARQIVGEPLWELMTGPPATRPPDRRRLAGLIADLERI